MTESDEIPGDIAKTAKAFATLIALAMKAERERCAKVAREFNADSSLGHAIADSILNPSYGPE